MLERTFQQPKFRVCCLGCLKLVEAGSGTDMTPASRKTRALIAYLCIVGKPVGRERLVSLLWGDRGEEQARASLRQAIHELRSLLGGEHLVTVERDTIAVGEDVGTDLAEITAAAESGDLEQLSLALSEWRGHFLEDLSSIDPSFDAWLQAERVRVEDHLVAVGAEAVQAGMARGEIEQARKIIGLLQQHDGTNEVMLRLGLRLDHLSGDTGALHRRYERFRELLKSELDAAPAAETQRLFRELTAKALPPSPPPDSDPDARAALDSRPGEEEAASVQDSSSSPDRNTTELHLNQPANRSRRGILTIASAIAVAIVCVLSWAIWKSLHGAVPSKQEPLLAVLPFQSTGTDAGSQTFSDGIGGDIAAVLRQTTPIRIVAAPSGLANAGAPKAPAATHILSGSVERAGDRIRVIAQLMNIQNDSVVWSHAYEGMIVQSSTLRHGFAVRIAGALRELLASGAPGDAQHVDSAAYGHYSKGRGFFLQRHPGAAVSELEAAVRLAPDFANAWSALAAARLLLATDTLDHNRARYDHAAADAARAAAQRALALDPGNGEAMGVLAMLIPATRLLDIDRQLEQALRSEPDNPQLLGWQGEFLMFVGRNHQASEDLTRAWLLDRATPSVASDLAFALLKSGRIEQGKEILDILDRSRDERLRTASLHLRMKYFLYVHDWFGLATWLGGLPDRLPPRMAALFHLAHQTAIALATHESARLASLRDRWRTEAAADPDDAAQFLFALRDDNAVLAVVQSAVQSRRNDDILTDPQWESLFVIDLVPLRRDPRVPALFAQWGLSDYWRTANHLPDFMR